MIEYLLPAAIAAAIFAASFMYHKRSLTYIKLTVMIGCAGFMLMTSLTDPGIRWFARVLTLVGSVAAYRLYLKLRSEQVQAN